MEKDKTIYYTGIRNIIIVLLIAAFTVAAVVSLFGKQNSKVAAVSNGELNLTDWNENGGDAISLSGKWDFYWNRLVPYNEIEQKTVFPDLSANVPSVWNRYRINGKNLSGFGCGTYVLWVTGVKAGRQLGLWIPNFSTAYRLYINDDLLASNGTVSVQKSEGVAKYNPRAVIFTPESSEFFIVVQVSNYAYARGGMWYSLYLGTAEQISNLAAGINSRDFFLIGCFLLMGFVFLCIFFLRRQEKSSLYFALLCLTAIGRTMIFGAFAVNKILPFNNFEFIVRLDYIIVVCFPGLFAMLVKEHFKDEIKEKAAKAIIIYGCVASLVFLATPVSFFTGLLYGILVVDFATMIYILICLVRAVLHGRADSVVTLVGFMAVTIGFIHDVLFQDNLIAGGYYELSPVGFFVMLALEAFVLSRRFTALIRQNEMALAELRITSERERAAELKFLKAQIRPHFLHNSLNTIISVSRKDIDRARELLIEFSTYLRGCFDFNNLNDEIPIENELEFIRSYITLEQARFGDKLKVEYDIDDTGIMVPPLILQPLVENSVIHGIRPKPEGGKILIYVKRSGNLLRLGVKDDGCGISQERAALALSGGGNVRGVGLNNINQRLNKIDGTSLQIKNIESGGTDVFIELRMDGGDNNDPGNIG